MLIDNVILELRRSLDRYLSNKIDYVTDTSTHTIYIGEPGMYNINGAHTIIKVIPVIGLGRCKAVFLNKNNPNQVKTIVFGQGINNNVIKIKEY